MRIERQFLCAFETQRDETRISAGSNDEVMFQLALVAVVHQIHTGIDGVIFHLGVRRHIRAPLLRVVADEVVGLARQLVKSCELRRRVRAH